MRKVQLHIKKYALNILKENNNYEYVICCDSEIDFIMENMNYENILNKINMIFENKTIFCGYTETKGGANKQHVETTNKYSGTIFTNKEDSDKLKILLENYTLCGWWHELPVYKAEHLNHFSTFSYNNLNWHHFDHQIYVNYL